MPTRKVRRNPKGRSRQSGSALVRQVAFSHRSNNVVHRETGSCYLSVSSTTTPQSFVINSGSAYSMRMSSIDAVYELSRCVSLEIQFTNASVASADTVLAFSPYIDKTPPSSFTQCSEQANVGFQFGGIPIPGYLKLSRNDLFINPYNWYHTVQNTGESTYQGLVYICTSSSTTVKMRIDYVIEFASPVYTGTELKDRIDFLLTKGQCGFKTSSDEDEKELVVVKGMSEKGSMIRSIR